MWQQSTASGVKSVRIYEDLNFYFLTLEVGLGAALHLFAVIWHYPVTNIDNLEMQKTVWQL